jgi:hypothetical protein
MSERSQTLARHIRNAKGSAAESAQGNHNELLDKGFALLKNGLAHEFQHQIADVNSEPGCMDTLGGSFKDDEARVFKLTEEDSGLTIQFDPDQRTAEINGKEPTKFHYLILVRLSKDQTKWCYAGGENKDQLVPITGKLDTVVEKALFALFGVEA